MASKRAQITSLRAEVQQLARRYAVLVNDYAAMRELYRDRNAVMRVAQADLRDTLLLLGKTEADLPELRQAASAIRYADEHEKQMAVAKDWSVTEP